MSSCKICHLDSKKHSKKLWALHQQSQICAFCQKSASEHSEKLWEMHKLAVGKGQYCSFHKKTEKLYPITIGTARAGIARVCRLNAAPPYDVEFIPIYMSCTECGLYLGSTEGDYADIIGGMCRECFRTEIEQTDSWYDATQASKKENRKC